VRARARVRAFMRARGGGI